MEPYPSYSPILSHILLKPSLSEELPSVSTLNSLQSNLEQLRLAAKRRVQLLESSRRRVESLRDRDAAREKEALKEKNQKEEREKVRRDKEREKKREVERKERKDKEEGERLALVKEKEHLEQQQRERLQRDRENEEAAQAAAAQIMARDAMAAREAERARSPSLPPRVVRRSTRSRSRSQTPAADPPRSITKVKLESSLPTSIPPPSPDARPSQLADSGMDSDASSTIVGAPKNRKKKRKREQVISSDVEMGDESRGGGGRRTSSATQLENQGQSASRTPSVFSPPPVVPTPTALPKMSPSTTTPAPLPRPKIKLVHHPRAISPLATTSTTSLPRIKPLPLPEPAPSYPGSHIDFSLPAPSNPPTSAIRTLVPPVPTPAKPMQPLPTTQNEVNEDFTNAKPGTQLLFATFWQMAEGYVRPVGEEDLAFLKTYKEEDKTPFVVPPLGRHYTEVWEEEDRLTELGLPLPGSISTSTSTVSPSKPSGGGRPGESGGPGGDSERSVNRRLDYPRMSKRSFHFNPRRDLKEEDLVSQDKGEGPLVERMLGGLVSMPKGTGGGVVFEENQGEEEEPGTDGVGMELGESESGIGGLEERMKKELMFVGLLGEDEIDWSQREDDEITTSLRHCQKLLAQQVSLNEARRLILLDIAKDRLAYSEYQQCLDGLDRIIDTCWTKRAKQIAKQQKRKKEAAAAAGSSALSHTLPSSSGGGPGTSSVTTTKTKERERERDEREKEATKKLAETIKLAIGRRKMMVQHLGTMFKEEEDEDPGRFLGLPVRSVYEGLEEEFKEVGLGHLDSRSRMVV